MHKLLGLSLLLSLISCESYVGTDGIVVFPNVTLITKLRFPSPVMKAGPLTKILSRPLKQNTPHPDIKDTLIIKLTGN